MPCRIVDGEVVPDEVANIFAAGRQADVPVLIGSNADESTTFMEFYTQTYGTGVAGFNKYVETCLPEITVDEAKALYPASNDTEAERAMAALDGDRSFTYPMRFWAQNMINVESNVYLYWFP